MMKGDSNEVEQSYSVRKQEYCAWEAEEEYNKNYGKINNNGR